MDGLDWTGLDETRSVQLVWEQYIIKWKWKGLFGLVALKFGIWRGGGGIDSIRFIHSRESENLSFSGMKGGRDEQKHITKTTTQTAALMHTTQQHTTIIIILHTTHPRPLHIYNTDYSPREYCMKDSE